MHNLPDWYIKLKAWSAKIHPQTLIVLKVGSALFLITLIAIGGFFYSRTQQDLSQSRAREAALQQTIADLNQKLATSDATLQALQNVDQYKKNQALTAEMNDLVGGFKAAMGAYNDLLQLNDDSGKKSTLSAQLTKSMLLLSQRNYASATAQLLTLQKAIEAETARLNASNPTIAANLPQSNTPPSSGSQRQVVQSDAGTFQVDIIAADLNSTRVVVETASDSTCADGCPVAALADYVARAGGFAGVNGPYFCPAEYPSCAGKTNSFDTLLMNQQKTYFNSDNNVYSTVPAVIFSGNSARFVGQSLEWGRDTSVDSVIAAQPMLLSGGNITFGGNSDPKQGSRGNRSFIGTKGNTVYIGVVHTATVVEVAHVLKALGLENALNLDSGGSTALFSAGKYIAGPGRQTPFGIVFVRK